jgi:hypothetical protein
LFAELATPLIAASGAIAVAVATYWFTKKREREAELRKEKLEHYKDFVASLGGILIGESTADGQRSFARASNRLNLIAPQGVISALQALRRDMGSDRYDKSLSLLFFKIRRDLAISPRDDRSLHIQLWTSGQQPPEPKQH